MAETTSKIRLVFDGVERGVVKTATQTAAAIKGLSGAAERSNAGLAGIGKSIAALAAGGGAVNVIGGVVGAVTALSGAALLIPGAALAGAAAMGTFKIATAGFGDAIGAGLTGDVAAFTEATKGMAPEMQRAAQAVVAFKPQIDNLKQTVQGEFWDDFSKGITKLGNTYMPILTDGLASVSRSLGFMAYNAMTTMSTPFFSGAVSSILDDTTGLLDGMASSVGDVLGAFISIGAIGASYLPQLGEWIGRVTDGFREWTDSLAGQNQIRAWIDQGIQAFSDLFAIIGNVGSVLGSVFSGLGGAVSNPLAGLRDLTASFAELAASSPVQAVFQALGAAMQAAGQIMYSVLIAGLQLVVPLLVALAPVVQSVATTLGAWAPVIGPIVVGVFAMAKGIQLVTTVMAAWRAVSAAVAVAQVALNIAMAANPIGLIVIAVAALVLALTLAWQNSETFRSIVTGAWEAVKTAVGAAVDWIKGAVAWFATLPSMAAGWFAGVSTAAIGGFTAMLDWLAALPARVLGFLMQLPAMAAYALGYLAGVVYLGAVASWDFLWNTLPQILNQVGTFLITLPLIAMNALTSLAATVLSGALSAWDGLYSTTVSVGSAVIAWVSALPGRIASFMSQLPGILISAAVAAWTGFRDSSVSIASATAAWISTLPGRIMGFFANAGSWLVNAGAQIIQGLWNGLRNAAQAVLDWIFALGRQIAAGFAAAVGIGSPSKVFAEFGVNIGEGLVVGIDKVTPTVVGSSAGMADAAASGAQAVLAPPASSSSGDGRVQLVVGPGADSATAAFIAGLVRTGKLQLKAA